MDKNLDFLGYPNYTISSTGIVTNIRFDRVLEDYVSPDGYRYLNLCNTTGQKKFSVHRLLALAFIEPVDGKYTIDHINRDRSDNRLENLRWADKFDQAQNTGDFKTNKLQHKNICKAGNSFRVVIRRNYTTVFDKSFKTLEEAIEARDDFFID